MCAERFCVLTSGGAILVGGKEPKLPEVRCLSCLPPIIVTCLVCQPYNRGAFFEPTIIDGGLLPCS